MEAKPARRPRDSSRSRQLLLDAALELFAERGFDRTTTREIGERAGVDAALIARYFGNKTKLYLAVLEARTDAKADGPGDLLDRSRLRELLGDAGHRAPGPVLRAALAPNDDTAVHEAARTHLYERLVTPLQERLAADGLPAPALRAELAAAALAGVALARTAGTLTELAAASPEQVVDLVHALLAQGLLPPAAQDADAPAGG
ncbi:helix-turn-helix domain-containing protein [Streptomyces sp. cg36]|uniref:TetR/AcrR family transcriptional regulator n=1 Tax=Streptomyces sp. cg36 TaxID=3238798 RepID=UPI0034E1EEF5